MLIGFTVIIVVGGLWLANLFQAPGKSSVPVSFVVPVGASYLGTINELKKQDFIKSTWIFSLVMHGKIQPGAYKISGNMNVFDLTRVLSGSPYMKWVTIPEGLRKEEVAELLASHLNWSTSTKTDFINAPKTLNWELNDGLFFPETYLFPSDETGAQIAQRMRNKFNDEFNPYSSDFAKQNIKWTTAVKLASIIQREAAGKSDMNLIAGILWNRLDQNIPLDIDATIQYARGVPGNWWPKLKNGYQDVNSSYNTYKNAGLPPGAISNPGMDAILAVLNPQKTNCLFYIHDNNRQIHCAVTYAQHQANIAKYLQ